jgi:hypothetical protein
MDLSKLGNFSINHTFSAIKMSKVNGRSNLFFLKTGRQLYNIGDPIRDGADIVNARQNARRRGHGTRSGTVLGQSTILGLVLVLSDWAWLWY